MSNKYYLLIGLNKWCDFTEITIRNKKKEITGANALGMRKLY